MWDGGQDMSPKGNVYLVEIKQKDQISDILEEQQIFSNQPIRILLLGLPWQWVY